MNDSFVSIVKDRNDEFQYVVRARLREDLAVLFPEYEDRIIKSFDTDYAYRLFVDKYAVAERIYDKLVDIDYTNFKDSVKQDWRKEAYTKIWNIMWEVQERFLGVSHKVMKWPTKKAKRKDFYSRYDEDESTYVEYAGERYYLDPR